HERVLGKAAVETLHLLDLGPGFFKVRQKLLIAGSILIWRESLRIWVLRSQDRVLTLRQSIRGDRLPRWIGFTEELCRCFLGGGLSENRLRRLNHRATEV